MKKNRKKITNSFDLGQAMLESLLIVVFLTMLVLAGMQLVILILDDLTYNEAAFAAARMKMVSENKNVDAKFRFTIQYLTFKQLSVRDSFLYNIKIRPLNAGSNNPAIPNVYDTVLDYYVHIFCAKFFNPFGINIYLRSSAARSVMAADPKFYNCSYPDSPRFVFDYMVLISLIREIL